MSLAQKLPEGTTIGNLSKTNDVLAYFGPPTFVYELPTSYGDTEHGVRFTSVSDNVTLDEAAFYFYQIYPLGTPDVMVHVYDVDVGGLPLDPAIGTVLVPFADINVGTGYTFVDLTSLGLSYNTGDEFYITYTVVGGAYGSVQMDHVSDDYSTTEERSVERWSDGNWYTMYYGWGVR